MEGGCGPPTLTLAVTLTAAGGPAPSMPAAAAATTSNLLANPSAVSRRLRNLGLGLVRTLATAATVTGLAVIAVFSPKRRTT